jgi:hypothetical protein
LGSLTSSPTPSEIPRDPDRTEHGVLEENARLSTDPDKSSHERYPAVFQFIQQQDRELVDTIDDLRRSTALPQLGPVSVLLPQS